MADASRSGSGKSLNMIKKQSGRMLRNLTAQIKQARKDGDRAKVNALQERRRRIQSIAERYKYNIRQRQRVNNGGEAPTGKQNQQYSRSIYTKGKMRPTRYGQVGQFRAEQGTGRGQNSGTRERFKNQYQYGIARAYSTEGQGTGNARRGLANLMKSGNVAVNAGIKKGVTSYMRSTNNNRVAQNARARRQGKTARVHSNSKNAEKMKTSSIIRRLRKDRRKNNNREFR